MWECICDCGRPTLQTTGSLTYGTAKSCGCLQPDRARECAYKDGRTGTRLYSIYRNMITRCEYADAINFKYYGARGIRICPEWRHNFGAFKAWALSHGYADNLTIDRVDNDGNYEPSNCRWITRAENAQKANATRLLKERSA